MNVVLLLALFAVLWWLVLFTILPIGLRTQDEEGETTLGSVSSAPSRTWHVVRSMLWGTVVSVAIFAAIYYGMGAFGISINDAPKIIPGMN